MPIVTVFVVIIVVGVLVWLATTYIPMAPPFKTLLVAVAVILTVLWLLSAFGVLPEIGRAHVPRAR